HARETVAGRRSSICKLPVRLVARYSLTRSARASKASGISRDEVDQGPRTDCCSNYESGPPFGGPLSFAPANSSSVVLRSRPRGLFIIPPPFLRAELVAAAGLRAAVLRPGAARSLGRQLPAPNAPTSLPSQEEMSGCSCRAGGYGQSSRTLVRGADNGLLC